MPSRWVRMALVALLAAAGTVRVHAQAAEQPCGSLANAYGPFEYRFDRFKPIPGDHLSHQGHLQVVEAFHFTPEVEALIRGKAGSIATDLDYTLRAFPNHHRALSALMRYWERAKSPQPGNLPRPAECYFERAVRFQPDDTTARMLYAMFLHKDKRGAEARQQLEYATTYAADNAFTHYNIGLVYFDLGEPANALSQAHRALALGFPRMELKNRLVAIGKWQEPAADAPPKPAAQAGEPAKP
jgi:tetratricopeptide (TPR) repeat protein